VTTEEPERTAVDRAIADLLMVANPRAMGAREFLGAAFDHGLAWVGFPPGSGGLGVSGGWQKYVNDRLMAAGAPSGFASNPLGYGMGGPTVIAHGTPEQTKRFLRPLYTGEEIWCQLFSEPGAGSDLANVATRARLDGDGWVVDGQKVWTSWAHVARWGMLLARTDANVPKHAGLTYFIADMHAPGVEVRPLRQITGNAEFNEVFFTEAHLGDDLRLGSVGDGWRVAMTTLSNERYMLSVELWLNRSDKSSYSARVLRDRLVDLHVRVRANRMLITRGDALRDAGEVGPQGSAAKVMTGKLNQAATELCVDLLGEEGMLFGSYEAVRQEFDNHEPDSPMRAYLRARANTIEGGTSEILHNILAERVLGLPGEPRTDKDRPWSRTSRG
jgi:alkylation response protein AidB-like acyl-CoA dehydrogenase